MNNEAIIALNLPWEQIGMVLSDQRITEGLHAAPPLRPRTADGTIGRRLHLTL